MGRREEFVDAALALSEEVGVDRVSMRLIGQQVGVSAMAIYKHFPNREALLDALVGRVLADVDLPDRALPWRARLHHIGHRLLAVAIARPTVFRLVLQRSYVSAEAIAVMDAMYQLLADAGVSPPDIPRLERMLSTALIGYAVTVSSAGFWNDNAPGTGMAPADPRWTRELDSNLADLADLVERFDVTDSS